MPAITLTATEALERMLHQASVDAEFRSELQLHPEVFGFAADASIPASVEQQDETFVQLLNNAIKEFDIAAQCGSTCSFGPLTIVCDGTTK